MTGEGRARLRAAAAALACAAILVPASAAAQTFPQGLPADQGFAGRFGFDMLSGEFSQVTAASSWALIGSAYTLAAVDPLTGALVPSDVTQVVSPDRAIAHDLLDAGLLSFDVQQASEQARALAEQQRRERGRLSLDRQEDLPEDFETARLARCGAEGNENFSARTDTVVAFAEMCRAAEADGVSLQVTSALRTPSQQNALWRRAVATYGSEEAARRWVAPSDGEDCSSNHCRGVALDIAVASDPSAREWLHAPVGCYADGVAVLGRTDCGGRIIRRAQLYGFIFPLDHEPWHLELGVRLG